MTNFVFRAGLLVALLIITLSAFAAPTLGIHITGIEGALLKNVQERLDIKHQAIKSHLTIDQIKEFCQQAPNEIKQALQPFGYFKPTISWHSEQQQNQWQCYYRIHAGPRLKITKLHLQITGQGKYDPAFNKLAHNFPVKQGQAFSAQKYQQAKQALLDLAAKRGYLAARMLKSEIKINLSHYRASVIIIFYTGPRYYFGPTTFSSTPFRESFLHRFAPFKTGDFYSNSKIQQLQQNLSNSNYFEHILITPKLKQGKRLQVPIYVQLTPRKAKQYVFGIGYGTDTGVRGLIGLDMRYLNSRGHSINALLKASQRHNILEANYIIPGKNPVTDQYRLSAGLEQENSDAGDSFSQKGAASYITKIKGWQQTMALTLQNENFTLRGEPSRHSFLIIPSIDWLRILADDLLKPANGYRVNINLQGSSKALLSDINYFQARLDVKYLHSFTPSWRFVARATLGYTAVQNLQELPLSQQFFTGGATSVRGYAYKSIGPGRKLVIGSVELQRKIYGNWYLAGFLDAGNASDNYFSALKKGAGMGIVWLSPIGALHLSVASALNLPGKPWRLQFSMGPVL